MGQYVLNPKTNKYEWQAATKTVNTQVGPEQMTTKPNLFQQLGAFSKNLNLDAKARNTAANRPTVVTSTELQEKGYVRKDGQWLAPNTNTEATKVGGAVPKPTQIASGSNTTGAKIGPTASPGSNNYYYGFNPYQATADAKATQNWSYTPETGITDSTTGEQITYNEEGQKLIGGKVVGPTDAGTGAETKKPFTPLFSAEDVLKRQTDLANQLRTYQDQLANTQSAADRRALAQNIRKTELAFQQARQQISEQDFMQQRALLQGAQARGLGGSGLEQLGRTQARMQTGQQLNQLAQQYGDQLQGYLNTQLGIEENLANALSGNALTELGNINEAELNALNQQWTQMQQNWTIEDRQKFDNEQTAANYIKLYQDLKAAGDNIEDRNALLKAYGDQNLLPKEMITEIKNLAVAPAAIAEGAISSTTASGLLRPADTAGAAERESYMQAMANDEGDGRLSMLKTGNTKLYFPNDTALLVHVKNLYSSRENSNKISIVIEGGKVVYKTPDGARYNTFNKASDALR